MIRRGLSGLVVGVLVVSTGCVAASVKENQFISRKQAVVVDPDEGQQVYVLDMETGKAYVVDLESAPPYKPPPCDP